MHFDLTEEQHMLKDSIESYLSAHNSDVDQVNRSEEAPAMDRAIWAGLAELGLPMILPSEEQGGLGMGLLELLV